MNKFKYITKVILIALVITTIGAFAIQYVVNTIKTIVVLIVLTLVMIIKR